MYVSVYINIFQSILDKFGVEYVGDYDDDNIYLLYLLKLILNSLSGINVDYSDCLLYLRHILFVISGNNIVNYDYNYENIDRILTDIINFLGV